MDVIDRPGLATAVIIVPAVLGALAGVGLAWLLVAVHALSPDNPVAGAALGFGGSMAGLLAGLILLTRTPRRP